MSISALYLGAKLIFRKASSVSSTDEGLVSGKQVSEALAVSRRGTIVAFIGASAPVGTLYLNAQEYYDSDYPELAAMLKAASSEFNGSSSLTFKVPDLRGLFLRGWDNARGLDAGRYVYSTQWHEIAHHNHFINKPLVQIDNNTGAMKGLQSGGYWGDQKIAINALGTDGSGGNETRPINYSVKYAIYY